MAIVRYARRVAAALLFLGLLPGAAHGQVSGAIAVYPQTSTLEVTGTRQFSAYVPISPNTIVWLVNGVQGGNTTFGTISVTGLYKPPTVIPSANVLTITAKSTKYPTSFGTAKLTITRPFPNLWSVSPSTLSVGNYSVSFNGNNFASDSQALANGVPVQTQVVSATKIVATGTAAAAGTIAFAVRQPGNGAVTGNSVNATVTAVAVAVTVSPSSSSVALSSSRTFSASVTGTASTSVAWSVNGIQGGSATVGTVTSGGAYRAPAVMPASSTVTVRATSVASPSAYGQATVTLTSPITVSVSPTSATLQVGGMQAFSASVAGTMNTAVTWLVNGVAGGSATVGTISAAGLYTAPAGVPAPNTVTIRATSVANPASFAQATVTISSVPPPATSLSAARFLEQSSFGPTPATLARVQQLGINAYLDEQFATPETAIPAPAGNGMGELRQWMLSNYTTAPDQLRQRVAYALSQIIVTSGNKLVYANEMLPWLQLLSKHAFGNYRDLLRDVSMSPSMGKYLDLANSLKPGMAGGANENYPRELMQLFTIGTWELNQDGSQVLSGGAPVPTYNQATVRQVALALTGWTYATAPGATPRAVNWEYFGAPLETRPGNHDTTAKTFLNCSLPANQSVQQDLDGVLDCLMRHNNIAPFIVTRLIRSLVMSNPSPAYVQRVADVFAGRAGGGAPGDLKLTVRAILTDPEARQDTAAATHGRLKEPILQTAGLLRALNGRFAPTNGLTYLFDYMAQSILTPPSVFSWFSPLYRVPGNPLFGPEFQIYSPTEATLRGNFIYAVLSNPGGDVTFDLSPFQPYGNDMPNLVEAVNQRLLYGRMPAGMKQALIAAASPGYDANTRIMTALYLTALSGQYAVQH